MTTAPRTARAAITTGGRTPDSRILRCRKKYHQTQLLAIQHPRTKRLLAQNLLTQQLPTPRRRTPTNPPERNRHRLA